MKLTSTKHNNGCWITCTIGQKRFSSWWASPPESLDHADGVYLKNRYSCLTTTNRVTKFKELYKEFMKARKQNE